MSTVQLQDYSKSKEYKIGRFRDLCRVNNVAPCDIIKKYKDGEKIDSQLKEILDENFIVLELVYG